MSGRGAIPVQNGFTPAPLDTQNDHHVWVRDARLGDFTHQNPTHDAAVREW
jgi:hypothetical protein